MQEVLAGEAVTKCSIERGGHSVERFALGEAEQRAGGRQRGDSERRAPVDQFERARRVDDVSDPRDVPTAGHDEVERRPQRVVVEAVQRRCGGAGGEHGWADACHEGRKWRDLGEEAAPVSATKLGVDESAAELTSEVDPKAVASAHGGGPIARFRQPTTPCG